MLLLMCRHIIKVAAHMSRAIEVRGCAPETLIPNPKP